MAEEGRRGELTTWNAIASHLGVSVRAAQRYEREKGLPVHRLPGEKSRVFAYPEELDSWKERLAIPSEAAPWAETSDKPAQVAMERDLPEPVPERLQSMLARAKIRLWHGPK